MQPGATPLRITRIEFPKEGYATYRHLNRLELPDPQHYTVMLWLSRLVDPWEQARLAGKDIVVDQRDPMRAYVLDTTLDKVVARLQSLNEALLVAENRAPGDKQKAEEEDARLNALLTDINARLAGPVS